MDIKIKQIDLFELILTIKDANALDQIKQNILQFLPKTTKEKYKEEDIEDLLPYTIKLNQTFDIEQLAKEQNYGIDPEKMDRLIEEMNIQEPLEDLLKMI